MSFWDHLNELRGTLIKSVVVFTLFAGLIGYYLTEFNRVLMWPFQQAVASFPELQIDLVTTTMTEGFNVIMQMCMFGGLMLAAPFILFFIGQFVAPALTEKEARAVLPMCAAAMVLFLSGAAFGFFLLVPSAVRFFIELNQSMGWGFRWSVGDYYNKLTWLTLGVGATFEFPLVIVLLVWLGLVTTAFLRKYRRHAIVVISVIASIVTPTTDPYNLILFAAPLYLLYEVAIVVATRIEKHRERPPTAALLSLLALLSRPRSPVGGRRLTLLSANG